MDSPQEDCFSEITQLWKESTSDKCIGSLMSADAGASKFAVIKTLMNMIVIGLEKIELESTSSSPSLLNRHRTRCRKCLTLQNEVLVREVQLIKAQDECKFLEEKLKSRDENPEPMNMDALIEEVEPSPKVQSPTKIIPKSPCKEDIGDMEIVEYPGSPRIPLAPIDQNQLLDESSIRFSMPLYTSSPKKRRSPVPVTKPSRRMIAMRPHKPNAVAEKPQPKRKLILDKPEQVPSDGVGVFDADETFFNPSQAIPSLHTKHPWKTDPPVVEVQYDDDGENRCDEAETSIDIFEDFDRIPNVAPSSPKFAYKPLKPIRKKEERAKLEGWDCDMCRKYYAALQSQLTEEELKNLKNKCSKHRSKYPVNIDGTPPDFWDVDLPSTAECIERGYLGQGQPSLRR